MVTLAGRREAMLEYEDAAISAGDLKNQMIMGPRSSISQHVCSIAGNDRNSPWHEAGSK